jgi:hypothetical protein
MTDHRPPPPEPEGCLTRSRASRFKGGTLIAEDVLDLATHLRRLRVPDGYRPGTCPRCGSRVLHVHDYVERTPLGEPGLPAVIPIVRHACADVACGAVWRILPAFLARHLWRVWPTVERTAPAPTQDAVQPKMPTQGAAPIPLRTLQRWRQRLTAGARQLVVLLATSGGALVEEIAKRAGLESTRLELVGIHAGRTAAPAGRRLADLAALVHRLEPGVRLM